MDNKIENVINSLETIIKDTEDIDTKFKMEALRLSAKYSKSGLSDALMIDESIKKLGDLTNLNNLELLELIDPDYPIRFIAIINILETINDTKECRTEIVKCSPYCQLVLSKVLKSGQA